MFYVEIKSIEVIPYVRMTTRGKFFKKRAIKYIENQNHLAWLFRIHGKGTIKNYPVKLVGFLKLKNLRTNADWDNYLKALQDALVKAGILPSDCVKYLRGGNFSVQKGENQLKLFLIEMSQKS